MDINELGIVRGDLIGEDLKNYLNLHEISYNRNCLTFNEKEIQKLTIFEDVKDVIVSVKKKKGKYEKDRLF